MAAGLNRHRMSVWSIRHCRGSPIHFQDWCRSFQHNQEGKPTMAVNQSSTLESDTPSIQEANKKMLAEEIAMDVMFLVR